MWNLLSDLRRLFVEFNILQQLEDAISDQSEDSPAADSQGKKLVLKNLTVLSNKKRTVQVGDRKLKFSADKSTKLLKATVKSSELTSALHLISHSQDEIKCLPFAFIKQSGIQRGFSYIIHYCLPAWLQETCSSEYDVFKERRIISDQDNGIKKALDVLEAQYDVLIESFACSKHIKRDLFKCTIAKHRRVMKNNVSGSYLNLIPKCTYNLISNTQDCARGLQLYNSVTPMLDIVTSNHCEILNAGMDAFRRLNPTNLIIEVLLMQCEKVKITESVTFDWNKMRQIGDEDEMNDTSDPDDDGRTGRYRDTQNYGSLLYSTNFITSSCLNSKETSVIVNRSLPGTQMTTHKHSVSWDCDLVLQELSKVL
ncbi:uncharacterized protein CYBJADRAFT_172543 [Cyberlindnera jadinii NRRL Y-1542]|uniref:Uncharacterized protein n=1 Tax=Cyberlindnera jadinii (strain ATCC 18201 / CBS 1600 / BCRC 20928 / JCM 3617 / NBRC 0987 / NRRL Y-1542) TaxID=983966 RepID=A0A1E4S4Z6_CYBJN|nr:hypothetical protein CYBJADRAFT_172543 [Cyberlindnera jadinii NRRL Y-1542]ODV74571.1 hypothetical protein CYBJADRAFT_172543 [Cyberlindnera jadinii NRRL Y-1542]